MLAKGEWASLRNLELDEHLPRLFLSCFVGGTRNETVRVGSLIAHHVCVFT